MRTSSSEYQVATIFCAVLNFSKSKMKRNNKNKMISLKLWANKIRCYQNNRQGRGICNSYKTTPISAASLNLVSSKDNNSKRCNLNKAISMKESRGASAMKLKYMPSKTKDSSLSNQTFSDVYRGLIKPCFKESPSMRISSESTTRSNHS